MQNVRDSGDNNTPSFVDGADISNFTITGADLNNLYAFATRAKLRMIFDLNVLIRERDSTWNSSNAWDIISFAQQRNMNLDWQLGNEPNSFRHVFNRTVTAEQLSNDYYQLRLLLNKANYSSSLLVGPEVNHVGDPNHKGEFYAKRFVNHHGRIVDYVTWHQYYLNGRTARVDDFISPATFKQLPLEIDAMKNALPTNKVTWLSETSSAYGGGAPTLSDKFVAGFLWLDKLGYSAKAGLNVVVRQSFYGGYYAMVNSDLMPNPDWWVSVIYKQFVSERVLSLSFTDNYDRLRMYAHCTPRTLLISRVPAITIYGMNIDNVANHIKLQTVPSVLDKNSRIFLYVLTADYLQSSVIKLNGETLTLRSDGSLPPFKPVILKPTEPITIPPYSMIFMVVHDAAVPACAG